jgi:threonine dehydratase
MLPAGALSRRVGGSVLLKAEPLQLTGSFKVRGAFHKMGLLPAAALEAGVVAASAGNHAQAVALVARGLGARADVFMPVEAPLAKVTAVRGYGAEVHLVHGSYEEAAAAAREFAEGERRTLVPPFDDPEVIAGQGTVGLEIVEDCADLHEVYVPVGGGGLLAGVAAAIKALRPDARVIGVEPAGAAKMSRSLAAGRPVTLESTASIADGLLPLRPGDLTFAHARALVDEVVTVDEDRLREAVRYVAREARIVVEPSGAASVAAVLQRYGSAADPARPVAAILSGGNIALDEIAAILAG